MLKKPGQLWILFGLCVCMILPAMIWLTIKTVRLDTEFQDDRYQTELARREAEIQEKITSALYRMDWKLGPHIAREAARPYFLYQSFYLGQPGVPIKWSSNPTEIPSPLLNQTSEFVKLHFQVNPDNRFSSPQRPQTKEYCELALTCCGVTEGIISERDQQLESVKQIASYELLNRKIEESSLFDKSPDAGIVAGNSYLQPQAENFISKFGQEIAQNSPPQQIISDPQLDEKSKVQRSRGNDRGGKEFLNRQKQYTDNTSQWTDNNLIFNLKNTAAAKTVSSNQVNEGVMRPIWIDDELLLARKVVIDNQSVVQCCWLAWDVIQTSLREEVKDILPNVNFEKVLDDETLIPERALVTLPVQLVVDTKPLLASTIIKNPMGKSNSFTGLQVALIVAWAGLFASVLATAILLQGVVQLSERRAAFVSAVTHELRTPLTTFKMYSEMLASRMVPPEKHVQYAETLHREADRLSHLVENVLQFARLERGSQKQKLRLFLIADLIDGIEQRLAERARDSGFTLDYRIDPDVLDCQIETEPHILEQVLFNLVDNACKYAQNSTKKIIEVQGTRHGSKLLFTVRDFGTGISKNDVARIFQPFHKSDMEAANTAPGVGLGLALCKRMIASVGGNLSLASCENGAKFAMELTVQNEPAGVKKS